MPKQQQMLSLQQALDIAVRHHTAGRLPQAQSMYQQILQINPDQPVALHLLGVIAHQVEGNDTAVGLITKAVTIKPDYAEAHNNLGNVFNDLGRLEEAVASYHRALDLMPDYAPTATTTSGLCCTHWVSRTMRSPIIAKRLQSSPIMRKQTGISI